MNVRSMVTIYVKIFTMIMLLVVMTTTTVIIMTVIKFPMCTARLRA